MTANQSKLDNSLQTRNFTCITVESIGMMAGPASLVAKSSRFLLPERSWERIRTCAAQPTITSLRQIQLQAPTRAFNDAGGLNKNIPLR